VRVVDCDLANIAGRVPAPPTIAGRHGRWSTPTATCSWARPSSGRHGGVLQAATIAIVGEVSLARLWHAVPAYPTLSEVWLRWLEAIGRPV
jgi:dihydrolipoamide dehydrogenase